MNAISMAHRAYAPDKPSIRTLRSTEYEVIAGVTRRLKVAADEAAENFAGLAAALHENRTLWTLLAADVANPDNALPPALRAQIFYLAEFTNRHTSSVLAKSATPSALLEINTAILRGLKQRGDSL